MEMPSAPVHTAPSLSGVLESSAAELAQLAGLVEQIGPCHACSGTGAEQWQALDRVSQHLAELSHFLAAVAVAVPELQPDLSGALSAIRLGRLFDRLTARPADAHEESGALELFGA